MSNWSRWILCVVGLSLSACPRAYVDDDHEYTMARQVILDMDVSDDLSARSGDKVDWKLVVPMADGQVRLTVVVGDPFKGAHKLVGTIDVFDRDKESVARARVNTMQSEYTLKWDAERGKRYWVRFRADSGHAIYRVEYAQKVQVDPCSRCSPDQRCEDGECVTPLAEAKPCGGRCTGGKYCNPRTNRCSRRNPCAGVSCPRDKICRGGVCKKRGVSTPTVGCQPKCRRDQRCRRKRCVPKKVVNNTPGVVRHNAIIISRRAAGAKTELVLNKGSAHGVHVGNSGSIGGFSFKVIQVYAVRCKVRVNATLAQLTGK